MQIGVPIFLRDNTRNVILTFNSLKFNFKLPFNINSQSRHFKIWGGNIVMLIVVCYTLSKYISREKLDERSREETD